MEVGGVRGGIGMSNTGYFVLPILEKIDSVGGR